MANNKIHKQSVKKYFRTCLLKYQRNQDVKDIGNIFYLIIILVIVSYKISNKLFVIVRFISLSLSFLSPFNRETLTNVENTKSVN